MTFAMRPCATGGTGFGPMFAGESAGQRVSPMRGFRHWRWHLDEMYVKLNGEMVCLWRAVDQEGEILESYITRTRDENCSTLLHEEGSEAHGSPEAITADGLRSYKAAMNELGNADKQEVGRCGEQPPLVPTTGASDAQVPTNDAQVPTNEVATEVRIRPRQHPQSLQSRTPLVDRQTYKERRSAALAEWQNPRELSRCPQRTRSIVERRGRFKLTALSWSNRSSVKALTERYRQTNCTATS
jgi:putative transposase